MITTTYKCGEGFIFEVDETQESLISKMNACNNGSAMVEFNSRPAYKTDIKNSEEAIRYVINRVESLITRKIGVSVHGIATTESSTEKMADGMVAVSHLVFQIQYI